MSQTTKTSVTGSTETEETYMKRVSSWWIFKTEWWEKVSEKHVGNDIFIVTDREIRDVYLNGKLLPRQD